MNFSKVFSFINTGWVQETKRASDFADFQILEYSNILY
jgi:hypothetical protein